MRFRSAPDDSRVALGDCEVWVVGSRGVDCDCGMKGGRMNGVRNDSAQSDMCSSNSKAQVHEREQLRAENVAMPALLSRSPVPETKHPQRSREQPLGAPEASGVQSDGVTTAPERV